MCVSTIFLIVCQITPELCVADSEEKSTLPQDRKMNPKQDTSQQAPKKKGFKMPDIYIINKGI